MHRDRAAARRIQRLRKHVTVKMRIWVLPRLQPEAVAEFIGRPPHDRGSVALQTVDIGLDHRPFAGKGGDVAVRPGDIAVDRDGHVIDDGLHEDAPMM